MRTIKNCCILRGATRKWTEGELGRGAERQREWAISRASHRTFRLIGRWSTESCIMMQPEYDRSLFPQPPFPVSLPPNIKRVLRVAIKTSSAPFKNYAMCCSGNKRETGRRGEVELRGRAEAAERREIIPVYENPSHKADNRSRCGFIWQQEQQQQQKEETY